MPDTSRTAPTSWTYVGRCPHGIAVAGASASASFEDEARWWVEQMLADGLSVKLEETCPTYQCTACGR